MSLAELLADVKADVAAGTADVAAVVSRLEGYVATAAPTVTLSLLPTVALELTRAEPIVIATLMAVLGDHLPAPVLAAIGPGVQTVLTNLVTSAIALVAPPVVPAVPAPAPAAAAAKLA